MPLGIIQASGAGRGRPTIKKQRTVDPYTGQVTQEAGPFTGVELEALRNPSITPLGMKRPGLPALPDMAAGMGGGGGPVGAGGASFARYLPRPQHRIESFRDGSTVARQSRGFEGLDAGFYAKNRDNAAVQDMRPGNLPPLPTLEVEESPAAPGGVLGGFGAMMGRLPRMEDGTEGEAHMGGPLPPGLPFIAGDSTDGKPNEELIIPTPMGTHVMPLDKLPKMAQGTVTRSTVPGQEDVLLLDSPYGTGFSTGALPPLPPAPVAMKGLPNGTVLPALPPDGGTTMQSPPNQMAQERIRRADALERERNPQGIVVGVTPRAPLQPMTSLPRLNPDEAAFSRMERDVRRAARDNPWMAMGLLQGKAAFERAKLAAEAQLEKEQLEQNRLDRRAQAGIEAVDRRAAETRQAAADRDQVEWQKHLFDTNVKAAMDQLAKEREQAQARKTFPVVNPNTGQPDTSRYFTGTGQVVSANKTQELGLKQLPGTNEFYRTVGGDPDLKREYTQQAPAQPGFGTVLQPGVGGPSFAPVPPKSTAGTKPPDPAKVRANAYKQALASIEAQIGEAGSGTDLEVELNKIKKALLERQYKEAMRDLDGDGVPDPVPGADGGASPAASSNPNAGYFQ